VVAIDQGAIRGSRRSNPATYTGLLDPIRKAFAKANGVKPALFSANSEGACPTCNGAGVIYTDLGDDGRRRHHLRGVRGQAVRGVRSGVPLGGRDISEVLAMSVAEAWSSSAPATPRSRRARDPCSGSRCRAWLPHHRPAAHDAVRRRAAAAEAGDAHGDKGGVYVLDEPTTGLHLADVENLLGLLDRLVDSGKSVIVIEHHQAVMAHADWIIDLGPGAGHDGGRIVFEGTPAELVADRTTLTGEHLATYAGA
jgi:excinuclease UvrABC ATPase subunit